MYAIYVLRAVNFVKQLIYVHSANRTITFSKLRIEHLVLLNVLRDTLMIPKINVKKTNALKIVYFAIRNKLVFNVLKVF